MSRTLGLLLAVLLLAAIAVPASAQGAFQDVPMDHWAYQSVQSLAAAGLIEGYPDGTFRGQQPMTRYEFAMLVARAVQSEVFRGEPGPPGQPGPAGQIGTAAAAGLTPEQQAMLAKLRTEFAPELAKLRDDANDLSDRVADLEAEMNKKPKVDVNGCVSLRTGLSGTELEFGASDSTAYPYPGIGGPHQEELTWFSPVEWGGITIPVPGDGWDYAGGSSIPISDALKDAFKAPDFMTMRTHIDFNVDMGDSSKAKVVLLADTRGNLVTPYSELDDVHGGADEILSNRTPNIYYSDGIMDSVRVDEAWFQTQVDVIRPMVVTVGKQYWGLGRGLLVNNSQFATKSIKVDTAITGEMIGEGLSATAIMGMLDREAFGGYTADLPLVPGGSDIGGQDSIFAYSVMLPVGKDWKLAYNAINSGFQSETGWSGSVEGKLFGLDFWGEYAELDEFPSGADVTAAGVDIDDANAAWFAGLGWDTDSMAITGQYGEIEPLYALTDIGGGWDPVGLGAILNAGGSPMTNGYLNLPLSLLHPVEEFNPHFINWIDRPLFLDATNVTKGWEACVTLKRLLGEKTPVSIRYYDGDAYSQEYLGWLFTNDGSMSKPSNEWRDADAVWAVTIGHKFNDVLSANLTYGQREVENVMSPDPLDAGISDDAIEVIRLDLNVAF